MIIKKIFITILVILFACGCFGCKKNIGDPEPPVRFPQIFFKNICTYKIGIKTFYLDKTSKEYMFENTVILNENEEGLIMDWDYPTRIEIYKIEDNSEKIIYTLHSDGKGKDILAQSKDFAIITTEVKPIPESENTDKYKSGNVPIDQYQFLWLSEEGGYRGTGCTKKITLSQNINNEIWK